MVSNYAPSKQEQANFDSRLRKKGDLVALSKVGVVDIGSNSVRLVVFDGAARSPAYYYNEKIMCALGGGAGRNRVLESRGPRARGGGDFALYLFGKSHGHTALDRGGYSGGA